MAMSSATRAGKAYLFGIGLLIFLAGAVFFGLMGRSYERSREMAQWPRSEALIMLSEVEERQIGPEVAPDYRFKVLFGYEAQGRALTSSLWALRGSPWSSAPERAAALAAEYPVGSRVSCIYDPKQPQVAVLKTETKAVGYAIWFPGIFVVGGLGIMLRAALGGGRRRARI
jgi:hypothetical protein